MSVRDAGRRGGRKTAERYPGLPWCKGRNTDLTEELVEEICDLIYETACSVYTAALSLGLPWRTVCQWEQWGREGRQPYALFSQAVMRARAAAELDLVRGFKKADREGLRSTQYYPFILSKRFPNDYGDRSKIDEQIAELSDAELQAELAAVGSRILFAAQSGGEAPALPAEGETD